MNVLSLFDGMSCGQLALEKAGVKVDNYFASEIKEEGISITTINYPNTKHLGDVLHIDLDSLPKIDLLIGGSPCQDFSSANKERKGHLGVKSGLFYEFVRIKNYLQKKNPSLYVLLENVKMRPEHKLVVDTELNLRCMNIDSSLLSPQLRDRFYWTNIPVTLSALEPNDITLSDILTEGYTDRKKARALLESDSRPQSNPLKMFYRYYAKGFTTLVFKDRLHYENCVLHFNTYFKGMSAKEIDNSQSIDCRVYEGVRFINRVERERCQTVPVGYTNSIPPLQSAGLLGMAGQ